MGSSDLWPPTAAAVRACSRQLGRAAAVLRHRRRRRRHRVAPPRARRRPLDARRHLVRLVRRRAVRARPSRSRASDSCSTPSSRTSARPTSAWSSSARRRACFAPSAARRASPTSPRSCARDHNGAQLLDALTLRASSIRPTARRSTCPRLLQRGTRRQPHRPEQLPRDGCTAGTRRRPRSSTRACTRARSVRTGGTRGALVRGAARRARGDAPPRGREAARGERSPVRPGDGRPARVHASVPAVGADAGDTARPAQDDRPDAARERRPRSVDAARVGDAGARPDDAAASSSSCPAPATRRSRARSATSRGTRSRASCSAEQAFRTPKPKTAAGGGERLGWRPTRSSLRSFVQASSFWRKGRTNVRSAILSTFPPRPCGIGVFSSDMRSALLDAPGIDDVGLLVVVDEPSSPQQPDDAAPRVSQWSAATTSAQRGLLGRLDVDVVLLQHEYGIYGGPEGEYVLSFARELSQPLVVTLHTLLSKPAPHQFDVLRALCQRGRARDRDDRDRTPSPDRAGACPAEKIRIVPHGAPALLGQRRAEHAAGRRPVYVTPGKGGYEGMQSRFLLSTFGLLSAGKGLETALDALPAIVERHPEVLYMIAGRTHPQVARREGEKYRLQLERQVVDLGLEGHVAFDDRFLSIDELADLLAATDVFVTPVQKPRADRLRRAHLCACRGLCRRLDPVLVRRGRPRLGRRHNRRRSPTRRLADAVCDYIEQPEQLAAARAGGSSGSARSSVGRPWPRRPPASSARRLRRRPADADPGDRSARSPRRAPITCNVGGRRRDRAARVRRDSRTAAAATASTTWHGSSSSPWNSSAATGDERWTTILYRALAFLSDATTTTGDGMRNFMSYDRRWLDDPHVGDHVGRVDLGARRSPLDRVGAGSGRAGGQAAHLARGSLNSDVPLRTAAYAILGIARLDPDRLERMRASCSNAASTSSSTSYAASAARLALVRGRPPLRQRPPPTGADRRRRGARQPGRRGSGLEPRVARGRVRARRRNAAAARPRWSSA